MRRALLLVGCVGCAGGADQRQDGATGAVTTEPTAGSGDLPTTGIDPDTLDPDDATTQPPAGTSSESGGPPAGPPTLVRIGETFVIPTLAASMPKRFADAAHDPLHDVWLVVTGNVATSGTVLDADGAPIGEPFVVADVAYTQGQRVAFGGDAFFVAWHDNRDDPMSARVRARAIAWDGSAPVLGDDVEIGTGASYSEMPPAIAWSESSQQFLVAWHTAAGDDIHAQRVAPDGTRVGDAIAVTADADWQSDAGLAWNPTLDEWLVVYTHAGATTEVRARIVAADGSLSPTERTLATAAGTWLAQAAYVPETGDYLAAWFDGAISARHVAVDGTPVGEAFVIAPGYGSYDGFAMAYSPVTERFAAVFHGTTNEDWAIAFDADGVQSMVLEATSSRGDEGHFNPHVAAHGSRPEWLLVTSRGFAEVVGQRLGP